MDSSTLYVDFEDSLNLNGIVGQLIPAQKRPVLEFLRDLYLRNRAAELSPSDRPRIPKIIHQIWLGSELPVRFRGYQQNWRRLHPDWDYKLWTDRDVENFGIRHARLVRKNRLLWAED